MLQSRNTKKEDDVEVGGEETTKRGQDAVPVRTQYMHSLLIKMSGLCAIILFFLIIGTAHTNNILVEENVVLQMNRQETIRMNKLSLSRGDPKTNTLMSGQQSLEPSALAAYSDALVKRITDGLPSNIWTYNSNSTDIKRTARMDDNLDTSFEIPTWLLKPWGPGEEITKGSDIIIQDIETTTTTLNSG